MWGTTLPTSQQNMPEDLIFSNATVITSELAILAVYFQNLFIFCATEKYFHLHPSLFRPFKN
jgi:hypothetical protein